MSRLLHVLALVLIPFVAGVVAVRGQEAEDPSRYEQVARGNRPAVLARTEVETLAAEVFGPDLAARVADVAYCESTYRPGARSAGWDRVYGYYSYHGLMQLSASWRPLAVALTGSDDLDDPYVNLVTARAVWERQGWAAWPSCGRTW